jgi:Outer membrane protein beta-barrel domain
MSLKPLTFSVLMALIAFTTPALAQQESSSAHAYELSGLLGRTFISDQAIKGATFFNSDVRFGNGLSFEVDPARRIYREEFTATPITLEMPVLVDWDEDLNTGANLIPSHFRSFFVTPSARVNFAASSAVSPWVSFGGGFGHFMESSTLLFGGPNPGKTGTTTGIVQGGVGFDVKLRPRWSLRTEARDFWSGVPQLNVDTGKTRQHNFFVGVGIVRRF